MEKWKKKVKLSSWKKMEKMREYYVGGFMMLRLLMKNWWWWREVLLYESEKWSLEDWIRWKTRLFIKWCSVVLLFEWQIMEKKILSSTFASLHQDIHTLFLLFYFVILMVRGKKNCGCLHGEMRYLNNMLSCWWKVI